MTDNENKLKELLEKVNNLSIELKDYQQQINLLKHEIYSLTGQTFIERPTEESPTRQKNYASGLENFIGLKLIHFVGIIVLLIGLTIGVKYAIDVNLISPAIRVLLTYVVGVALFLLSYKLRKQYMLFSLILFSGAVASAYFTTYAAYEYYKIFDRLPAFIIMLLLTFFTVFTALKYNRVEIAILGLVGAYGVPFFVGGNSGNLFGLFTYVFFINVAILFISYKRYWLQLTYFAFFTTWIIYLVAFLLPVGNLFFDTKVLFAFLYFFLFLVNSLVFKFGNKKEVDSSDTFIIFINTIFLYASLLTVYKDTKTITEETVNLFFAIAYMVAGVATRIKLRSQLHLSNTLFAISLFALIVYAGLTFSGISVTIAWGVIAICSFITGILTKLKAFRVVAILIFTITLIKLLFVDSSTFSSLEKIVAYIFTGTIILIVSFLYQKFGKAIFGDETS